MFEKLSNFNKLEIFQQDKCSVETLLENGATQQRITRVLLSGPNLLGNDLEPQEWRWILQNKFLKPITTLPAQDKLLSTIF